MEIISGLFPMYSFHFRGSEQGSNGVNKSEKGGDGKLQIIIMTFSQLFARKASV